MLASEEFETLSSVEGMTCLDGFPPHDSFLAPKIEPNTNKFGLK